MPKNCSKMTVTSPFMHRKNTVQTKRNTLYINVLRLYFIEKIAKKVVFAYIMGIAPLLNSFCTQPTMRSICRMVSRGMRMGECTNLPSGYVSRLVE